MTAEPIAKVVSDLRSGRVRLLEIPETEHVKSSAAGALDLIVGSDPTVVDATEIHRSIPLSTSGTSVYGDYPCIAPPFSEAAIGYVNREGLAVVLHAVAASSDVAPMVQSLSPTLSHTMQPSNPDGRIDWEQVRWQMHVIAWMGGPTLPTMGPCHGWEIYIYEDGSPANIQGGYLHGGGLIDLGDDYVIDQDRALLVLLGTLNFLSCRNVELVEPQRPRPERRRLAAAGVTVKTLNVFPMGRSSRGGGNQSGGVPLTSVRGSFHHYGPKYGRGLLFGRHEGKFWVPQHARGDAQNGRVENDYRLHTAPTR